MPKGYALWLFAFPTNEPCARVLGWKKGEKVGGKTEKVLESFFGDGWLCPRFPEKIYVNNSHSGLKCKS